MGGPNNLVQWDIFQKGNSAKVKEMILRFRIVKKIIVAINSDGKHKKEVNFIGDS